MHPDNRHLDNCFYFKKAVSLSYFEFLGKNCEKL